MLEIRKMWMKISLLLNITPNILHHESKHVHERSKSDDEIIHLLLFTFQQHL